MLALEVVSSRNPEELGYEISGTRSAFWPYVTSAGKMQRDVTRILKDVASRCCSEVEEALIEDEVHGSIESPGHIVDRNLWNVELSADCLSFCGKELYAAPPLDGDGSQQLKLKSGDRWRSIEIWKCLFSFRYCYKCLKVVALYKSLVPWPTHDRPMGHGGSLKDIFFTVFLSRNSGRVCCGRCEWAAMVLIERDLRHWTGQLPRSLDHVKGAEREM